MVPTTGLEPVQLAPLPPQDSVSTNSTTSAKQAIIILNYFCSCTGFSASAGVFSIGAAGTSLEEAFSTAGAGGTSLTGTAGAVSTAAAGADVAAPPMILPDSIVRPDARNANANATKKKTVARIPVVRLRKLAEPCEPNTVPDAPLPKAAPASAPLPCCIKINTIIATETTIKMINNTLYSITFFINLSSRPYRWPEIPVHPTMHHRSGRRQYPALQTIQQH